MKRDIFPMHVESDQLFWSLVFILWKLTSPFQVRRANFYEFGSHWSSLQSRNCQKGKTSEFFFFKHFASLSMACWPQFVWTQRYAYFTFCSHKIIFKKPLYVEINFSGDWGFKHVWFIFNIHMHKVCAYWFGNYMMI